MTFLSILCALLIEQLKPLRADNLIYAEIKALAMEVIGNPKRLSGCCDLDGCNGPNLVCQSCKSEVATAKYDCWMPRHIIIRAEGADIVP